MVLTVGDDYNDAALFALCAKALDTQANSVPNGRSLHGNGTGVDAPEEHFGAYVVGGDRKLHKGRSGKDHQADPVFLQAVRQAGNGQLGALQAVGGVILGQHGIGHVQGHDNLCAFGLAFCQAGARSRPGQPHRKEGEGQAEESHAHPSLAAGAGRHQGLHQQRVSQGFHPFAAEVAQQGIAHEEYRNEQQQIQILVIGKH